MMEFVCLAAGRGTRFNEVADGVPKPFLTIDHQCFYQKAYSSLPIDQSGKRKIILHHSHQKFWQNHSQPINEPMIEPIFLMNWTQGPVETAIQASNFLNSGSVLFFDSDLYCVIPPEFFRWQKDEEVHLLTFNSQNPNYSYVEKNSDGSVERVWEKQVRSEHAVAGFYLFRDLNRFKHLGNEALKESQRELYFSDLINKMLEQKFKVICYSTETHIGFGTPNEHVVAEAIFKRKTKD